MSYTNTTENLELPLYVGSDKPSYLGDWNETMDKLDTSYGTVKTVESNVSALETTVNGHTTLINANTEGLNAVNGKIAAMTPRLNGTELVIFGDSWAAPTVAAATWPTVVGKITGLNVHNYAIDGASFSNAYMNQQVQTFINDKTFDKAGIAAVIMVFGVNDQHIHSVAAGTEANNIVNWMNTFVGEIPASAPIIHIPNWAYGFIDNSIYKQGQYWCANVFPSVKSRSPRYQFAECFSWLSVDDFNTSNWYHLTSEAYSTIFAHNIGAILGYGEVFHKPTYILETGKHSTRITMNINQSGMTDLDITTVSITEIDTSTGNRADKPFPFRVDLTNWAICTKNAGAVGSFAVEIGKGGDNTLYDVAYGKTDVAGKILALHLSIPWAETWG